VHFDAVFYTQKTWTVTKSLATRILRFNREMKLTKTVQNYPKIRGQTKGGGGRRIIAPSPEYATVLYLRKLYGRLRL